MSKIILTEEKCSGPVHCQYCGGLMRLVGSEPHPVQDTINLLTYECSSCDEFLVLPIESPANRFLQF